MKLYQAIVEKVISNGRHGPYAVARTEELGPVTFSLAPPVWSEQDWPEPGTRVVMTELRKKRAGWRATSVRYFTPADEQEETGKRIEQ